MGHNHIVIPAALGVLALAAIAVAQESGTQRRRSRPSPIEIVQEAPLSVSLDAMPQVEGAVSITSLPPVVATIDSVPGLSIGQMPNLTIASSPDLDIRSIPAIEIEKGRLSIDLSSAPSNFGSASKSFVVPDINGITMNANDPPFTSNEIDIDGYENVTIFVRGDVTNAPTSAEGRLEVMFGAEGLFAQSGTQSFVTSITGTGRYSVATAVGPRMKIVVSPAEHNGTKYAVTNIKAVVYLKRR